MKFRLYLIIGGLTVIALAILGDLVGGDWGRFTGGFENLYVFFTESMWPPDWSVLEARSYPVCESNVELFCSVGYIGMMETLKIAFVSTILGFIGAILLSPLAARNLQSVRISIPVRILLSFVRSLPSLIWAIIFVIVIGFGPLAGVLAMTFYTVGYLGKLQYETFEGMHSGPLEAGRAMGLSKSSITLNIVVPENSNHLLSQLIFMFEYNVRHGTVIGIVGAGGVGYYINNYLKFLQYDKVFALLLLIFVVVIIIDLISLLARSFVNEQGDVRKPSWLNLLLKLTKSKNPDEQQPSSE
ncbi:MAG: phosphonate ABC transporter, permease protein PhnE [Euryarchaeota archaeon]|jgi:phosphonate transport system permease protein|nr:phosphonate ABC transporter, permease protein PhnE [Euryarchaeota archaeon]|tara:strand:+ start:1311 stop:2207 length:897 start_codon:yes stop_codon:yes gene_type:complete